VAFGRTYSDWAAAWQQWAQSISVSVHPLFDNGDCNTQQSGPVFFLGGSFKSATVTRTCTVPAGKALFFPVVNFEDSTLEESVAGNGPCTPTSTQATTINCLRQNAQGFIDPATNLVVTIDGESVPNLKTGFREQSVAFDFTLPSSDNVFNNNGDKQPPGGFLGGTYSLAVDDGIYVMLAPLSTGTHKLHFTATLPQVPFTLDVKYTLIVK
jgi:hypothetical protein